MTPRGISPVEIAILLVVGIGAVAIFAIPAYIKSRRLSNEQAACAAIKTFASAESDFRSNDRDGSLINEFWTGDSAGLYFIVPAPEQRVPLLLDEVHAIKLIEKSVALADGDFGGDGLLYAQHAPHGKFAPYSGYHFIAAVDDRIAAPPLRVKTDAGTTWGESHNLDRFAFIAFPTSLTSGKTAFIVNADNTIFKLVLAGSYSASVENVGTTSRTRTTLCNSGHADLNVNCYPLNPMGVGFSKFGS